MDTFIRSFVTGSKRDRDLCQKKKTKTEQCAAAYQMQETKPAVHAIKGSSDPPIYLFSICPLNIAQVFSIQLAELKWPLTN